MFSRKTLSLIITCLICSLVVYLPYAAAAPGKVNVTDIKAASGKDYKLGDSLEINKTKYYIDRDYVITAMPKELEGIQWIMTANSDDKNSQGKNFLTFKVDQPAVIWIAHDSRGEGEKNGKPPQWLVDGFKRIFDPKTNPDFTLAVTDASMGTFNLWKQSYKKGEVVIGGNADAPAAGHGSNYIVLIEADKTAAVQPQDKLGITWGKIKSAR
ncbi:MAG: hypothetical protein HYZ69_01890 [Candidatus Colwellbacteria bacterium]|nr:hypothetical protein [Candidatus Colwellbacteria bacterium]